jgi:MFS family permease
LLQPTAPSFLISLVILYGAVANTLYPITVSHANDFAAPEDFVKVSGGLLLLYGIGTIIGPTVGGPVMSAVGPYALFAVTAIAHVLITGYAIVRSRMRASKPAHQRDAYKNMPSANSQMITPESLSLASRSETVAASDDPAVNYG